MLSYQHIYHAGNFADVQKHLFFCAGLQALTQKSKPFAVIDAFAGRGWYDLSSQEAQKTQEYRTGILQLQTAPHKPPPLMATYLEAVQSLISAQKTSHNQCDAYPGSPALACHFARATDHIHAVEKHPGEWRHLQTWASTSSCVHAHNMDAFHAIESLCPPQEKRGIVLIDPSYELKADYQRVVAATQHVIKHWRNGMLMLWYPILHANYHTQMKADICAIANRGECVISEIIYQQSALRMLGSGMLVLNPPYQLQSNSSAALDFFNQCLPQTARFSHTIQTY